MLLFVALVLVLVVVVAAVVSSPLFLITVNLDSFDTTGRTQHASL